MQPKEELQRVFSSVLEHFLASPVMMRIQTGDFGREHYVQVLRQIYFYAREDPQLQAFATAWFRGSDRELVRGFLKHAVSEVGHEQLALSDLRALGADVAFIAREFPLPTTVGLTSFPYWAVQFLNPVSYLGYLYFLEGLPTSAGKWLAASLEKAGMPQAAMGFLAEHASVDVAHIKLMDRYVDTLIRTERDLFDVSYSIRTTAKLYELMIAGAFEAAELGSTIEEANLGEVVRLVSAAELRAA